MLRKLISLNLIVSFCFSLMTPVPKVEAQGLLGLPEPGAMVALSASYQPVLIKGVTVHQDNPFLFDFIVDVGQDNLQGDALKAEGEKLIKYFLANLAIPEKEMWVNLSPYEKDRVIPHALGQTELGRDLLAQDYILKQITASLIYPESGLGKMFWDKIYKKAQELYGTPEIPTNIFNKVWIMADKAEIFERNQTAFVVNCHLKVMLEEDYLAVQKHEAGPAAAAPHLSSSLSGLRANEGSASASPAHVFSKIIREIVLPELEREVNNGRNFANLRQIFNSIILSSWYKNNLKNALFNEVYADKQKVSGINLADPTVKEKIYERYLQAYKKGVFNFIKDSNSPEGKQVPRKYFSGGVVIAGTAAAAPSLAMASSVVKAFSERNNPLVTINAAMAVSPQPLSKAEVRIMKYIDRAKKKGLTGEVVLAIAEQLIQYGKPFIYENIFQGQEQDDHRQGVAGSLGFETMLEALGVPTSQTTIEYLNYIRMKKEEDSSEQFLFTRTGFMQLISVLLSDRTFQNPELAVNLISKIQQQIRKASDGYDAAMLGRRVFHLKQKEEILVLMLKTLKEVVVDKNTILINLLPLSALTLSKQKGDESENQQYVLEWVQSLVKGIISREDLQAFKGGGLTHDRFLNLVFEQNIENVTIKEDLGKLRTAIEQELARVQESLYGFGIPARLSRVEIIKAGIDPLVLDRVLQKFIADFKFVNLSSFDDAARKRQVIVAVYDRDGDGPDMPVYDYLAMRFPKWQLTRLNDRGKEIGEAIKPVTEWRIDLTQRGDFLAFIDRNMINRKMLWPTIRRWTVGRVMAKLENARYERFLLTNGDYILTAADAIPYFIDDLRSVNYVTQERALVKLLKSIEAKEQLDLVVTELNGLKRKANKTIADQRQEKNLGELIEAVNLFYPNKDKGPWEPLQGMTAYKAVETVLGRPLYDDKSDAAMNVTKEMRARKRVLVVDDNPEQRRLVEEQLTNSGYQVVVKESGQEALDFLTSNPRSITFVLSDFEMGWGQMNGQELYFAIRANPRLSRRLPFLLRSGMVDEPAVEGREFRKALQSAGIQFVGKRESISYVQQKIDEFLFPDSAMASVVFLPQRNPFARRGSAVVKGNISTLVQYVRSVPSSADNNAYANWEDSYRQAINEVGVKDYLRRVAGKIREIQDAEALMKALDIDSSNQNGYLRLLDRISQSNNKGAFDGMAGDHFIEAWSPFMGAIIEMAVISNLSDDAAMAGVKEVKGGIDLQTSGIKWDIRGDMVDMKVDPALPDRQAGMVERFRRDGIDGMTPVILHISPLKNIWPILGLDAPTT